MAWITQLANKRSGFSNLIDRSIDPLPPSSSLSSYFDGWVTRGECRLFRVLDSRFVEIPVCSGGPVFYAAS